MSTSVVVSYVHVLLLSSVTSCTIFFSPLSVEFCQSVESSSRPVKCYLIKCPCELHHVLILTVSILFFSPSEFCQSL